MQPVHKSRGKCELYRDGHSSKQLPVGLQCRFLLEWGHMYWMSGRQLVFWKHSQRVPRQLRLCRVVFQPASMPLQTRILWERIAVSDLHFWRLLPRRQHRELPCQFYVRHWFRRYLRLLLQAWVSAFEWDMPTLPTGRVLFQWISEPLPSQQRFTYWIQRHIAVQMRHGIFGS